jgi:hypothetical protein
LKLLSANNEYIQTRENRFKAKKRTFFKKFIHGQEKNISWLSLNEAFVLA